MNLHGKLLNVHVKGIDARSPRDCFREGAAIKIISNPKQWFIFLEKRNLTTHAYKEIIVEEIIQVFDEFSAALKELREYIENEKRNSTLS